MPAAGLRLGFVVEDNNNWWFLKEVLAELSRRHRCQVHPPLDRGAQSEDWRERLLPGRALRDVLSSNDVVFFEWAGPLLTAATATPLNVPCVNRLHSYELYEWAPKINWTNVDRIVLVSEAMRRRFLELYPSVRDKIRVVRHGVDLTRFQPRAKRAYRRRLGMMCALLPVKRVYEMILALHKLRRRGMDYRLSLAGPPGTGHEHRYAAALRGLVSRLGLGEAVTFLGRVEDAPAWYREIDVFVSNSYWEGAQVALMEAMASGCFCLSHSWEGAEEMLPPSNLFLSDDELLLKLLEYDEAGDAFREQEQRRMCELACEQFDIARTVRDLEAVLTEAARSSARRGSAGPLVSEGFWRAQWQAQPPPRDFPYFEQVARHLPQTPGASFLEIGCAPGGILVEFCRRLGYVASGVDSACDPAAVEAYLRSQGVAVGRIHGEDVMSWQSEERYDIVASFGFVEHFHDPVPVVDRHFELVRPGGYVVIGLPNFARGQWLLHRLFDRENLRRHNTKGMRLSFLQARATMHAAHIVEVAYIGGHFGFWHGKEQRSRLREALMNGTVGLLERVAATLPEGANPWFSPYIIGVFRARS